MPINAIFRNTDAEQRSYSWLGRLRLGRLLFAYEPEKYRKIGHLSDDYQGSNVYDRQTPWQKALADANHVIYDNLPLKAYYQKKSKTITDEDETTSLATGQTANPLRDPLQPMSTFITAGWWNPLAFLEFITLAWANWATDRLNPLMDKRRSRWASYFHISLATGLNALAKTINQVFTPLTAILLGLAAMKYTSGMLFLQIPALAVWGVGAALFIIGAGLTHYPRYKAYFEESGAYAPEARAFLRSLGHVLESLVLGVLNPVFRLVQKGYFLAKSHPKIAVGTLILGTITLFALVGLPLIPRIPSPLHFAQPLFTALSHAWTPVTSGLGLSALGKSIFHYTLIAATALGLTDLIIRTGKSVAEIKDDYDAEKNVDFGPSNQVIDFKDTCAEDTLETVVKATKRDEPWSISERDAEPHKAYAFLQYQRNYAGKQMDTFGRPNSAAYNYSGMGYNANTMKKHKQ